MTSLVILARREMESERVAEAAPSVAEGTDRVDKWVIISYWNSIGLKPIIIFCIFFNTVILRLKMARIMNAAEVGGEAQTSGDDLGKPQMSLEVMGIGDAIGGAEPAGFSEESLADSDCRALVDGRVP